MRDQLEQNLARFEELERQLVDPDVQANSARLAAVAREHGSLAKLATKYRRFKQLNAQIAEAAEMLHGADPETAATGRGRTARTQGPARSAIGTSCWT